MFYMAYPTTLEPGKHSLWTEWHGIARYNNYAEDGTLSQANVHYVRVQNEHGDRSETFRIRAWRPWQP